MLFNSFSFLIFFPVVVLLYFLIPYRYRTLLLLIASGYFYMVFVPKYIFILLFLITADYFLAKAIEKRTGRKRKILLLASILANLGTLAFFKYFNFFSENIAALADFLNWNYSPAVLSLILPLGLSFHVFTSLSYVIEVYRGKYKPEKNFLTYALYVSFFPKLVSGPIERPYNLLPQLHENHNFNYDRVAAGLQRILWGFFKKIVIADNLALYVNQIYGQPHDYSGLILLTATVFFAFQLYSDFSGYTDIAIGSAQILGFKLTENFDRPYFSVSIAEFWRRWHISLSSWLSDYVYYPLVFSAKRISPLRLYFALLVTFVLIGLWHGANWTFVMFGTIQGFYIVLGKITKNWREWLSRTTGISRLPRLRRIFQMMITFGLVLVGFVFFRADTLGDAYFIITNSFSGLASLVGGFEALKPLFERMGVNRGLLLPLIAIFITAEIIDFRRGLLAAINSQQTWIRWLIYIIAILAIMNLGVTFEAPFIYFRF
ncbi:MAG: MBOAT family O-acyltransferase [Candidatus Azambacteria bacterium]|nr:MBOAT family O-acyltransferase [Candidatus Azambacteria bacterium]